MAVTGSQLFFFKAETFEVSDGLENLIHELYRIQNFLVVDNVYQNETQLAKRKCKKQWITKAQDEEKK